MNQTNLDGVSHLEDEAGVILALFIIKYVSLMCF